MDDRGKQPQDGPANCVVSNNFFEYIGYININITGSNHVITANTIANSFGEGDAVRAWGANHHIVANTITNLGCGSEIEMRGHPDVIQTFGDWGTAAHDIVFE